MFMKNCYLAGIHIHAVHVVFFFFNDRPTAEIYTLSLHDALPIWCLSGSVTSTRRSRSTPATGRATTTSTRSEEHTSELQSRRDLVCRLLLDKNKDPHDTLLLQTTIPRPHIQLVHILAASGYVRPT